MNDEGKRPCWTGRRSSARCFRDDGREMPAGFSSVSSVRKELRSVRSCTPAHIFDGCVGNAGVSQLESNERSEVAVRLRAVASNDRTAVCGLLHLASDIFTDLERIDADVRTDRYDELVGRVRKGVYGARYDPGNRTTPSSVHRAHMPARRMGDQHRHAIRCPRRDANAFDSRDQRIPFFIGDRFHEVRVGDGSHPSSMHLALLEQAIDAKPEALGETASVLANGDLVVPQVEAQVQAVVGGGAHPARARGKRMAESVLIQKGRMQGAHGGVFSTPKSGQRATGPREI